jgi:hypothetical protein
MSEVEEGQQSQVIDRFEVIRQLQMGDLDAAIHELNLSTKILSDCLQSLAAFSSRLNSAAQDEELSDFQRGEYVAGPEDSIAKLLTWLQQQLSVKARDLTKKNPDDRNPFTYDFIFRLGDLLPTKDLLGLTQEINRRTEFQNIRVVGRGLSRYIEDWIDREEELLLDRLAEFERSSDIIVSMRPALREKMLNRASQRIGLIEQDVREVRENAQIAAGDTAAIQLAGAFDANAEAEQTRARLWTAGVFAFLAVGLSMQIWGPTIESVGATPISELGVVIFRALTGLPLYATAAYCARIAAQHRETARHMQILTSQIKSVRAYVSSLPKGQQHEIIALLGNRAFSDPGLKTRDKGKVGMLPDQLIPALEKAMDVAKEAVKRNT